LCVKWVFIFIFICDCWHTRPYTLACMSAAHIWSCMSAVHARTKYVWRVLSLSHTHTHTQTHTHTHRAISSEKYCLGAKCPEFSEPNVLTDEKCTEGHQHFFPPVGIPQWVMEKNLLVHCFVGYPGGSMQNFGIHVMRWEWSHGLFRKS
jgi:hypothetical protein